tara:strand:+ start:212 stop:337 length:126 start_codon:yes stop_codon:yes gene_type:complete
MRAVALDMDRRLGSDDEDEADDEDEGYEDEIVASTFEYIVG